LSYSHFVGESLREREREYMYMSEDPTDGRTSNYSFTFTAVHYSNSAVRERPLADGERDATRLEGSVAVASIHRSPASSLPSSTDDPRASGSTADRHEAVTEMREASARACPSGENVVRHTKQWTHWRANLTLAAQARRRRVYIPSVVAATSRRARQGGDARRALAAGSTN